MAAGNEVSRSSSGPIGDFPLNPPWQEREEEEKAKAASDTKSDTWDMTGKHAATFKYGIGDLTVQVELRRLAINFADALYKKLMNAEKKYSHGNAWKSDDWRESCLRQLFAHIDKGDPLDVAAYCAFAWHHKWSLRDEEQPLSK